ncbi:Protein transport protein SSS1 [Lachancea thermotolerans]|uniref:KLTH0G14674p n=2 Tax=Lachancea TaxID=300275 RepID=C5DN72_LACTC|nr:KLTH0G14674p [Lachancea thermotolerans CBS 6340]CAR25233.1 KLTH0G14674p [Lachancea thermotolerans CBS 6340]CUS22573.1 LAQU0S06e01112g1_1 [Lachancea quebecensis]
MAKSNNQIEKLAEAPVEFVKDGTAFIQKCKKPSNRDFLQIVRAVGIGFVAVGIIGYAIKLVHIPIRYLIV